MEERKQSILFSCFVIKWEGRRLLLTLNERLYCATQKCRSNSWQADSQLALLQVVHGSTHANEKRPVCCASGLDIRGESRACGSYSHCGLLREGRQRSRRARFAYLSNMAICTRSFDSGALEILKVRFSCHDMRNKNKITQPRTY